MATSTSANAPAQVFVTTHWSVVRSARDKNSAHWAEALERLCQTYWYPLYVYVRRSGHGPEDAQDLTQEFFARLLQKDYLHAVTQEKGRFRTFLLVALKRFLANEWDRLRAQKRGGGRPLASLDEIAEQRYRFEPAETLTPDKIYERRWALTLLDQAFGRLQEEFGAAGKAKEFEYLKTFLTAERGEIPFSEVAARMQTSEGAARLAVHRLRKRFREALRTEIAHTVSNPEELDEELRHMFTVLSR